MADTNALVQAVLTADKSLRDARTALREAADQTAVLSAVDSNVDKLLSAELTEDSVDRLACLSELLADFEGVAACKTLLRLMDNGEPAVRHSAGEAMIEHLYDHFGEAARMIEAEIEKGTAINAMREFPFLFAEVGEPGGAKIVARMLKHTDGDIVASAIEGLAEMGDTHSLKQIEGLKKDRRKITVHDDDGTNEMTVGEIAEGAIEHLRSLRDG